MKLSKLTKLSKKVLAVVLALVMTFIGNYFLPKTIDAAQPGYTDAIIDNTFHTIGTDGWQYKFRGQHLVEYKGGTAYDDPLVCNITRSEANDHDFQIKTPVATVTPGHTYRLTMRIDNAGSTTQGNTVYATVTDPTVSSGDMASNFNNKVTVPAGSYREIELEFVAPSSGRIYSKVNWGWSALCEFTFTPTLEDITPDDGYQDAIIDNSYHTISDAGFQYRFRGKHVVRYKGGESIDDPLFCDIKYSENGEHDFQTKTPAVSVSPGHRYRLTYRIDNLGAAAQGNSVYATVTNVASSSDIVSSYSNPVSVPAGSYTEIELEFDAPASGQVCSKLNWGWSATSEFKLTPTFEDITPSGYEDAIADGQWHTISTNGFQYRLDSRMIGTLYKGGTSFNDPLNIKVNTYANNENALSTKTPVVSVQAGHKYKLTYNIANIGNLNQGAGSIYAEVYNANNNTVIINNYNSKVGVNAGSDTDIELEYMAPESGQVYFRLIVGWANLTEFVLTPVNTDLTPDAQPITPGQWEFAGANNTGWQYFVRANGSAYMGGTSIGDDLTVNYGTYVNDEYTCIVRSPITAVDSAKTYTGTMTIKNNSNEAIAANVLHVSVHWYDAQTGQDGEISAATSVTIPAGQSQTFDLSYTAPDSGYIFYEASTSYTPGVSSFTYSATHTPPTDGRYDVAAYKSGTTATYPEKSGKIFAGWYDDAECTTVHTGNTGLAFAKFIDEEVLTVKFQVALNGSAIRFVSSLDNMNYDIVGFKFTGTYGGSVISEKTKTTESLYRKITADGTSILPSVFSSESNYFFTYTVRGMTNAGTNSTWKVTPFYVTLDGTTVTGKTGNYPQT